MKIGFVGLGAMGQAMAARLLEAGHSLVVHNRTPSRAEPLLAAGAHWAETAAAAATNSDLVFSMVADDDAAASLCFAAEGVLAGLAEGAIHLSSSTISVALARRLAAAHAERNQRFIAAPVLGRPPAARDGSLFVLAAGNGGAIETARPALQVLSQKLFVLGDDPTAAALLKLSLNGLIFSTIEQMGEVFALNQKNGTDPAIVFDVLTGSFFGAPVHRNYGRLIVDRQFDNPNAPMSLAAKDTRLLLDAGTELGVPLPLASLMRDRLLASIARGETDRDFAKLSDRAREDAGLPTE